MSWLGDVILWAMVLGLTAATLTYASKAERWKMKAQEIEVDRAFWERQFKTERRRNLARVVADAGRL